MSTTTDPKAIPTSEALIAEAEARENESTSGQPLSDPHEYLHEVHELHEPIVREQNEPKDGYEPIPVWLAGAFGVLLFFGGWYTQKYSLGFDSNYLEGEPIVLGGAAADDSGPAFGTPEYDEALVELGKRNYSKCQACHQANGLGVEGQYPPLAGSEWVVGRSGEDPGVTEARLTRILLHGIQGPLEVNGATYNANMPAWNQLSDKQIAGVLSYIRTAWDNNASLIYPQAVEAARQETAERADYYSESELLAVLEPDEYELPTPQATVELAGGQSIVEPSQYSEKAWEDYAVALVSNNAADPSAGQQVFGIDNLQCKNCHKVAGTEYNGNVGPELTQIGNTFPPAELAKHILYPSVRIHPDYKPVLVATWDGETISGVLKQETAENIVVQNADGDSRTILKDDIDERLDSDVSIMPAELVKNITAKEFADLIAYLHELK